MLGVIALLFVVAFPTSAPTIAPHPAQRPSADLFSRRARHRAAVMLRLRWEELRLEQLERIRTAIRRQVPIDDLLRAEHVIK